MSVRAAASASIKFFNTYFTDGFSFSEVSFEEKIFLFFMKTSLLMFFFLIYA